MNVMDVRESVVLTALAGLAFAVFACAAFAVVRRLRAVFAARCRFVGIGLTVSGHRYWFVGRSGNVYSRQAMMTVCPVIITGGSKWRTPDRKS